MPTVAEVIKHLKSNNKLTDHIAAAIWCEEDIFEQAKRNCIKVTREQAQDILDNMDRHHDCELGMTWDTIDYYLDELVHDGKATRVEPEEDE